MRRIAVLFVLVTCMCYANPCPDARLQQAIIGGDTIDAWVRLHDKPLKFAPVRLFSSNGKTTWAGKTDKDGGFHIGDLRSDAYRLDVRGWGTTTIRISPGLDKLSNGQKIFYSLQLLEDGCIGVGGVTN